MEPVDAELLTSHHTNIFSLNDYRLEKKLINKGIVIKKDSENQIRLLMRKGSMADSSRN